MARGKVNKYLSANKKPIPRADLVDLLTMHCQLVQEHFGNVAMSPYPRAIYNCKWGPFWYDTTPHAAMVAEAWKVLHPTAYIMSCLISQNTPRGRNGVEVNTPFALFQMWKPMSDSDRRKLIQKELSWFYKKEKT